MILCMSLTMFLPSIEISLSMSKKKPVFNYKPKWSLPPLSSVKTAWDLKGLYYRSENDPKLDKDMAVAKKAYADFAGKWRTRPFAKQVSLLKKTLTLSLIHISEPTRPY